MSLISATFLLCVLHIISDLILLTLKKRLRNPSKNMVLNFITLTRNFQGLLHHIGKIIENIKKAKFYSGDFLGL
jgi:hypothetical protein